MMQLRGLLFVVAIAGAIMFAAVGHALPVDQPLLIGGQPTLFTDTSGDGCPDPSDFGCSVVLHPPLGSTETISCNSLGTPIDFNFTRFDVAHMQYAATDPTSQANYTTAIVQRSDGPVGLVTVFTPNGEGSGLLCREGTSNVLQVTVSNFPSLLFGMEFVNCTTCPTSACVPDMTTPTHVRTNLLLPLPLVGFPSIYFPVIGKVLIFTVGATELARLDLANLGSCAAQRSAAPTLTNGGMLLAVFLLLAVGTWFLGRRRGFSESLSLF